jgi:hypothetical protein
MSRDVQDRGNRAFSSSNVHRRDFLKLAGAGTAAAMGGAFTGSAAADAGGSSSTPETTVKQLYDSLSDSQKKEICFPWDHVDAKLGLLRTRIAANWRITKPAISSDFYTPEQRQLVREIFEGIIQPDWHERFDKQLKDDDGGFGTRQRIAIFGAPGSGKFQFVFTGRHITIRCDGNSDDHLAFGGPLVYGHAASGFTEKPNHPGNVFWHQAVAANKVYHVLDGRQQKVALIDRAPKESAVGFRGPQGELPGVPVAELSGDQKRHMQDVLKKLIAPFRQSDRDEVVACLDKFDGLDGCSLSFYRQGDLGNDGVWDIWRLEGPAFVWHFRGSPHIHTWVHVADDPTVELNA